MSPSPLLPRTLSLLLTRETVSRRPAARFNSGVGMKVALANIVPARCVPPKSLFEMQRVAAT